jgi:hypothetical protein
MRKLLIVLGSVMGALVLVIVLPIAALIGYDLYADNRADKAVALLCESIKPGSNLDAVIAAAARRGDGNRPMPYDDGFHFVYQAGIFHSRDCVVDSALGKVVAVRIVKNDD